MIDGLNVGSAHEDVPTTDPSDGVRQPRLFDPDRYSPVTVAVWQRLPDSSARAFAIASALGSFRDAAGTSDRIRSGRQAVGSLLKGKRLRKAIEAIGIEPRQWRRYVADWEQRYLAHRCERGVVCLFTVPLLERCPACRQPVEVAHVPPAPRGRRGAGYANGRSTTARAAVERPQSGSGTTARVVQERPLLNAEAPHQQTGLLRGEVGVAVSCRCGHEHFTNGRCRRPACDCFEVRDGA